MDKSLNIVFFGIDGFSNVVLNSLVESEHKVLLVITHPYDDKAFKSLSSTCDKNNIPIIKANKINSDEVVSRVRKCSSDLCVIAHFERIIRSELLGIPKLGFINLHPSLLPYYRGLAPQHYPIINGEKEVGITVHYVDENENQVSNFLSSHKDFTMVNMEQLLPDSSHDGFFICVMKKN